MIKRPFLMFMTIRLLLVKKVTTEKEKKAFKGAAWLFPSGWRAGGRDVGVDALPEVPSLSLYG